MESTFETRFFLGANSPTGFYSLYDGFTDDRRDTLYVVKGGPGCGKSTFMRTVAAGVRAAGHSVEYIHCSGDPDSLDGVYFPALAVGYVDGTAPHVIEPRYVGASGNYVNVGDCYDADALKANRDTILRLTDAYKDWYSRAYRLISAAHSTREALSGTLPEELTESARKRARGIAMRELRGTVREGGITKKRFLSAVTCRGPVCYYDTVKELCDRVYVLDNELGLGMLVTELLADEAEAQGLDIIRCLSPMDPSKTEHLIIPELSLAFVTQTPRTAYPYESCRHLRLDAVPRKPELAALKNEFRTAARLSDTLLEEAVRALGKAKSLHDRLEEVYNPHVHFDLVTELARRHTERLLG